MGKSMTRIKNPLLRGVAATALAFVPLQGMQLITEQPVTETRSAPDLSRNAGNTRLSKNVDPVTDKTFEDIVINSSASVVMIYVGEANCSSCGKIIGTFEKLAKMNKDKVNYRTLNHETERAADKYIGARKLPVMVVFKGGTWRATLPGDTTADEAQKYIVWLLTGER